MERRRLWLSRGAGLAISVRQERQRNTIEHPSVGTRPIASPQTGHHFVIVSISRIANSIKASAQKSEAFRLGSCLPTSPDGIAIGELERIRFAPNQRGRDLDETHATEMAERKARR
jgi:hypothetical protein